VYAGDTGAWQAAAQAIGLKVVLKSVPAQNYINFFTDPKARAGIDGLPAVTYGDYADPAALLNQIVLPGGVLNLDGLTTQQSPRYWSRRAARPAPPSGQRWWPGPRS